MQNLHLQDKRTRSMGLQGLAVLGWQILKVECKRARKYRGKPWHAVVMLSYPRVVVVAYSCVKLHTPSHWTTIRAVRVQHLGCNTFTGKTCRQARWAGVTKCIPDRTALPMSWIVCSYRGCDLVTPSHQLKDELNCRFNQLSSTAVSTACARV